MLLHVHQCTSVCFGDVPVLLLMAIWEYEMYLIKVIPWHTHCSPKFPKPEQSVVSCWQIVTYLCLFICWLWLKCTESLGESHHQCPQYWNRRGRWRWVWVFTFTLLLGLIPLQLWDLFNSLYSLFWDFSLIEADLVGLIDRSYLKVSRNVSGLLNILEFFNPFCLNILVKLETVDK